MVLLKLTSSLCGFSKHLRFQRFQTISRFRLYSQSTEDSPTSSPYLYETEHKDYGKLRAIYKFPHMATLGFIYNCKYILIPGYILLLIGEGIACYSELIDALDIMNFCIMKVIIYCQILLVNKLLTNFIGFIYLTEDNSLVIAYTDFWGKRKDEKFAKGELILKCDETNGFLSKKNRLYVKLLCPATGRVFKMNLKRGVMNEAILEEYFGRLPRTAF